MAKKKAKGDKRITNKRARFDYELGDSLVVGLQLTGAETKALRMGNGTLRGAYVTVKDNELWLINAQVSSTRGIQIPDDAQTRTRKLLAKRAEIDRLIATKQQGNTIVPLELLTGGRYIKLRIAAGKGKKTYDKRETIKRRQQERDIARKTR
ncbi:MAG TPA: SsrA-binding protein SmpB [Candidatus Saccharimonadales bacterium]|nr:SsrA-binding protein SmpB [Candidatus Saccharimonadales bacterium]